MIRGKPKTVKSDNKPEIGETWITEDGLYFTVHNIITIASGALYFGIDPTGWARFYSRELLLRKVC
jgi:hypothetical protein